MNKRLFELSTLGLARQILGMELINKTQEGITAGIIVEVEAYLGLQDKASHAYSGNVTKRTSLMYGESGIICLYNIRGMNIMLNIVSGKIGIPEIIFIRAIQPTKGQNLMICRRSRNLQFGSPNDFSGNKILNLTNGPGRLCCALGISKDLNGKRIGECSLSLEESTYIVRNKDIVQGPRINIGFAENHVDLPYRLWLKNNQYVSKNKTRYIDC